MVPTRPLTGAGSPAVVGRREKRSGAIRFGTGIARTANRLPSGAGWAAETARLTQRWLRRGRCWPRTGTSHTAADRWSYRDALAASRQCRPRRRSATRWFPPGPSREPVRRLWWADEKSGQEQYGSARELPGRRTGSRQGLGGLRRRLASRNDGWARTLLAKDGDKSHRGGSLVLPVTHLRLRDSADRVGAVSLDGSHPAPHGSRFAGCGGPTRKAVRSNTVRHGNCQDGEPAPVRGWVGCGDGSPHATMVGRGRCWPRTGTSHTAADRWSYL